MGTQDSCQCDSCKRACKHKPGWFKPGEAERLAAKMGLSIQEVFDEHLAVDWWEGTPGKENAPSTTTFVLAPATEGIEPGGMYPANPRGVCTFFTEDGECSIHETGEKPFECQESLHGQPRNVVKNRHAEVATAWDTEENQALIRDLLGREPEAQPYFGGLGIAPNPFAGWSR